MLWNPTLKCSSSYPYCSIWVIAMEYFDYYFFYCNLKSLKLERNKNNSKGGQMYFKTLPSPPSAPSAFGPSASSGLSKQSRELLQPLQTLCLHHFHMPQYLLLWNAPEVPPHQAGLSDWNPACWEYQRMGTLRDSHWVKALTLKISQKPEGLNYNCGYCLCA